MQMGDIRQTSDISRLNKTTVYDSKLMLRKVFQNS